MNYSMQEMIDAAVKLANGEPGHEDTKQRMHLGASIIGRKCIREIWYHFRFATPKAFDGRMLRLFATGFKYEDRFDRLLTMLGVVVEQIDPSTRDMLFYHPESDSYVKYNAPCATLDEEVYKQCDDVSDMPWHVGRYNWLYPDDKFNEGTQFRVKDSSGHFSGSLDGKAYNFQNQWVDSRGVAFGSFGLNADTKILTEFKTHNDRLFKILKDQGVKKAKPEHYVQMATYMQGMQLPLALYCAANKNTDELFFEFVQPDDAKASEIMTKANAIVYAATPPGRISNSPSWEDCRYCDHRLLCHFGQAPQRTCRMCVNAYPADKGQWRCKRWNNSVIPDDVQLQACPEWKMLTD